MTDLEFESRSRTALERLNRELDAVAEEHDAEVLYQGGVLSVDIADAPGGKIIVSPNSSAKQIWISAQRTSFKLDWAGASFVFAKTTEPLDVLVHRLIEHELSQL